jgi:hypothetical protein
MQRQIVYIGQIPQDTDILLTNRNAMISDGWVAQGVLGTGTLFSGLACTPTGPAGMTVNVAPGCVFSQQNIDNSAYGSLTSDTTEQIIKIGISLDTINFSCPAPATTGQSVVYLIEAAFVEEDSGAAVLPYYNAANPATPWSGPNNLGTSQNTVRQNICSVQVKVGVPATTGSQTTPAPDTGYTGLWTVTVANGQTTITSGSISQVGGAPFISETLTQKISQATADTRYAQITSVQNFSYSFANDTSGSANTVTATLSPVPAGYSKGMAILLNIANNNTGSTNINLNGLGNKAVTINGNALVGGELKAGHNYWFSYNGTNFDLNSVTGAANTVIFTGGTSTGSANTQAVATTSGNFANALGNVVTWKAGFTNTGATTLTVDSASALTIKKPGSSGLVDLAAGDIESGEEYMGVCQGTYLQLVSPANPSAFLVAANEFSEIATLGTTAQTNAVSNLGIAQPEGGITHGRNVAWASNTTISVAASSVVMKNATGQTVKVSNPSGTLNSATLGAGGIDVGTVAANQLYYIYNIYKASTSTWEPIMSLSATAPSFANASGYAYSSMMSVAYTDGSGNFIGFTHLGTNWQYKVGSNLTGLPSIVSGTQGSTSTPTFVSASMSAVVPPNAASVLYVAQCRGNLILAPNNNYGPVGSTTNSAPVSTVNVGGQSESLTVEMVPESSNVYYASDGGASGSSGVFVLGFTLNI